MVPLNQSLICYFCSKEHNYSKSGFPKKELVANLTKEWTNIWATMHQTDG